MKFRIVFCVFLLLCVGAMPVMACTPTLTPSATPVYSPTPLPTITDYAHTTPIIFLGTVLREVPTTSWSRRYEIQIETYLKGSGYAIAHLDGYGYGSDCLPMIWEGSRRIFFVSNHMNSAGIPVYYRIPDYEPTEADIAAVTSITGQSAPAQPLPLDIQLNRIAENGDLNWLYIPLSILAALLGLVIVALSLRRNRRKSKAKRE